MRVIFRKNQTKGSCPEMVDMLTPTDKGYDIWAVIHLDLFRPPTSNIYKRIQRGEEVECDLVEV